MGTTIDGQEDDEHFGFAVSLNDAGTRIAVGADLNDGGGLAGADRGRVQIFEYDGLTTWNQLGSNIDGQVDLDQLGFSVSLDAAGDSVAIGTFGDDTVGAQSGQARIYDWSGAAWAQRGIDLDGAVAGDESGRSVSLSADGTRIAIGAPQHNGAEGHTRVYEYGRQFAQHVIVAGIANVDEPRSVYAVDVDSDGDIDVVSASRDDNKIAWYANDGTGVFGAQQVISTNATLTHGVFAVDLDGDSDMDVLATAQDDDTIYWYENDGSEIFTEHVVTTNADGAYDVFAIDLNADGDIDVVSASENDNKISWYENDGNEVFTEHVITTSMNGARSVFASDLDGDGDNDIMSASADDDKIVWYENDGTGTFALHVITTGADGASSVYSADINGDGSLDIIASSWRDDTVAWFEHDATYQPRVPISPLTLEAPVGDHELDVDNIKQHQDLLSFWYGIDVMDPGPFGFQDHTIPSQSALPLQDNQHEGAYLSGVHIDFIERGMGVTGSVGVANPLFGTGNAPIAEGTYQLEIRRGSFEPLLAAPFIPMDTNDRLTQSYTLEVPAGSNIIDGQTFDISDSIDSVRFEYDDTLIGVPAFEGVTSGNLRVPFNSEMEDWEVARVVRDLINSGPVQATIDVAAALSDGVDGTLFPDVNDADNERDLRILRSGTSGITTSNKINLFGSVYVVTDTNVLRTPVQEQSADPDSNDTLATATPTGISGFNSPKYVGQGAIGDNPNLPLTPGLDVEPV